VTLNVIFFISFYRFFQFNRSLLSVFFSFLFLLCFFGINCHPSELNSIGMVSFLRVPPIAHDDGFLVSICIISCLFCFDDV